MAENNNEKEITLGKLSITPEGTHTKTREYSRLCLVQSEVGDLYLSLEAIPENTELSDSRWWKILDLAELREKLGAAADAIAEAATATTAASSAKSGADTAAAKALLAAALADSAKTDASDAAAMARSAALNATNQQIQVSEKVSEMEALAQDIVAQALGIPYRMEITCERRISIRNGAPQYIKAQLYPTYNPQNVIFQQRGDSIDVDPVSGAIELLRTGKTKVWVIPTDNTKLGEAIEIEVAEPSIRMNGAALRLAANGILRIN